MNNQNSKKYLCIEVILPFVLAIISFVSIYFVGNILVFFNGNPDNNAILFDKFIYAFKIYKYIWYLLIIYYILIISFEIHNIEKNKKYIISRFLFCIVNIIPFVIILITYFIWTTNYLK